MYNIYILDYIYILIILCKDYKDIIFSYFHNKMFKRNLLLSHLLCLSLLNPIQSFKYEEFTYYVNILFQYTSKNLTKQELNDYIKIIFVNSIKYCLIDKSLDNETIIKAMTVIFNYMKSVDIIILIQCVFLCYLDGFFY